MFIRIENRKIHYKKFGKGKSILFVHGWGGNMYSLYPLAELAAKNRRAYLLDLPGFGRSDNPPPHWGVEGYADLILQFVSALRLERIEYFGHSFGGELGLYLAALYPQLFRRLIVCGSPHRRLVKVSPFASVLKQMNLSDKLMSHKFVGLLRKAYYKTFHRNSDLTKYPDLESNFRKIVTDDISEKVKKIRVPTLILWGENDSYVPLIEAYQLQKSIAGSKLEVFSKAGHDLPIKRPEEVWERVESEER